MLLRRPLRRVKFAQRRLRVFPMGAGGMPPASGRAPPAKRRRGARGNRLPHAEAHLLQLLLQDAAGGHEDRRHGARAARLPGRHDGAALLLPGQHVHRVREARLRPHLGTGEVPPEPCPQDAEQGRCCSGPLMRAGAACRRGRALPPAPGARSPRGDAAGPPSRLRGRAGEFLDDGGQLGGSCAPAASPLLCLCSGGRANECALALRGAAWAAQWPAHTRMMTQGWAGAVGMAAWRAPARRRAAARCGRSACLRKLGDGARAADADSSMQQPGTLCYRLTVPLEATQSRQHELRSHPPTCCRPYFTSLTTILRTPMHMALRNPLSRTVFSAVSWPRASV